MKQLMVISATATDIRKLERLILKAKDAYYNGKGKNYTANADEFPAEFAAKIGRKKYVEITDSIFDRLENALKKVAPNSKALKQIGAEIKGKQKVKLEFFMGSLDKLTPTGGVTQKWLDSVDEHLLISDKIDGVSILVIYNKGKPTKAFTRGDGHIGQDISFLVPHMKLPKFNGRLAIRGEMVISTAKFSEKWKKHFKNPRNMVAGITNRQDVHAAIKDIDVIIYEVLEPRGVPSKQLKALKAKGFHVVPHKVYDEELDESELLEILMKRQQKATHEIDGLVVTKDVKNPLNRSGNPDYSKAFKAEGAQESANATVVSIEWEETRHGYLAPRIRIRPIKLRGVTVNYASGKNAGFLKKNRVGPGAVVRIRRAGDVIPDLKDGDVIKGATPTWPDRKKYGDWEWTDSGVNIKLKNAKAHKLNDTVAAKVLEHFFVNIGVEGFRQSTLEKFVAAGYRTVKDILKLSQSQFTKVEGTNKTIVDVYNQIHEQVDGVDLATLMDASNIFGRGMGKTRCSAIIKAYPNIMKMGDKNPAELQEMIEALPGFSEITAKQFSSRLGAFCKWLKSTPQITWALPKKKKAVSDKMAGQRVIMSGFRDADLSAAIEQNGGEMVTTVRQATFLLVKDPGSASAKTQQAKQLGIKIMTPDEFRRKYRLA